MAKYSPDGEVTPMIFSEFVKRNPGILMPAFHMQVMIRQRYGSFALQCFFSFFVKSPVPCHRIINEKFWDRIADRRFDMYADQKDGGWLHIRRELKKNAMERAKHDGEEVEKEPKAKVRARSAFPDPCFVL